MTSTPFPVEKTWFYFSLLPQILRACFASKVLPNFTIKIAVSKGSEATEVWVPAQTSGAQAPFFGGLLGLLARSALRATPPQFALRAGCRFFPKTKVLLNFFQKIAGSRGSETASVWFQTKLTGAKRLPRGFSANAEARHTPRRPCGLSCGLGVGAPSPQAPPRQAGRILLFHNLKFYSIFFKKSRFPKAGPLVAHRNERNTLSCEAHFSGELPRSGKRGLLQVKKPPCRKKYETGSQSLFFCPNLYSVPARRRWMLLRCFQMPRLLTISEKSSSPQSGLSSSRSTATTTNG